MNTAKLRSKRVAIPAAVAVVAALSVGGIVWSSAASADVQGSERDRVAAAAVQAVGGGTVTEVETSDDPGEAYEAEVRKDDGTEVDVKLDKDLKVINQEPDDQADTPDRVLTDAERKPAETAALTAVADGTALTGGTVTDVEASDDPGVAYKVDVRGTDNKDYDVELDAAYKVVRATLDD